MSSEITDNLVTAGEQLLGLQYDLQSGAIKPDPELSCLLICIESQLDGLTGMLDQIHHELSSIGISAA